MRKSPAKRAQVSIFENYLLFPRDHTMFFRSNMPEKALLLFFLLSTSFSYPRNTSQSSFPVNLRQKLVKKFTKEEKVFLFFLFIIFFHKLSLTSPQKTIQLTFSIVFITGNC